MRPSLPAPTLTLLVLALLFSANLLSACSSQSVHAAQVGVGLVPTPSSTPTQQPPPTRPPTATAMVFALKASSTPPASPTAPAQAAPAFLGPDRYPPGVNPLTGLVAADPALLERSPILVKITNFPRRVRPQWGLNQADHVYEYYLEDGMTRFVGVFYGQDAARVGPVRSGRFFDEHLLRMYRGYLVFGAADPRVLEPWTESDLKNRLILERPDNCPPLCRIGPDTDYNTLYVDTAAMAAYLAERGSPNGRQDLHGLYFEPRIPYGTTPGLRVAVGYSRVSYNYWEYDPESGRYLRFSETQEISQADGVPPAYAPLTGSQDGEPVQADNLVVLHVPHEYFLNTRTTEMVQIHFQGAGAGYAYRDGLAFPIQWERGDAGILRLTYAGGYLYPLKPGRTFFQVVSTGTSVVQLEDQSWQFSFSIP